jgi:hypothetical protein
MGKYNKVSVSAYLLTKYLPFVEGVVYEVDPELEGDVFYEYVKSTMTGDYPMADVFPCDKSGNILENYTSPIVVSKEELKNPVWEN